MGLQTAEEMKNRAKNKKVGATDFPGIRVCERKRRTHGLSKMKERKKRKLFIRLNSFYLDLNRNLIRTIKFLFMVSSLNWLVKIVKQFSTLIVKISSFMKIVSFVKLTNKECMTMY